MLRRRPTLPLALAAALVLLAAACEVDDGDPLTDDAELPAQTPVDDETPVDDATLEEDTPAEATPADEDVLAGDPDATVLQVLEDSGEFTRLVELLQDAGLDAELESEGPFTVFAPTDQAFERLPDALVERFQVDAEQLEATLLSHVSGEELPAEQLTTDTTVEMLDGSNRTVLVTEDDMVLIGPAAVVDADAEASNGVVHAIDLVLSPVEVPEE